MLNQLTVHRQSVYRQGPPPAVWPSYLALQEAPSTRMCSGTSVQVSRHIHQQLQQRSRHPCTQPMHPPLCLQVNTHHASATQQTQAPHTHATAHTCRPPAARC